MMPLDKAGFARRSFSAGWLQRKKALLITQQGFLNKR